MTSEIQVFPIQACTTLDKSLVSRREDLPPRKPMPPLLKNRPRNFSLNDECCTSVPYTGLYYSRQKLSLKEGGFATSQARVPTAEEQVCTQDQTFDHGCLIE